MAASDQIIFHCRDLQSHYRRMPDCSSECSERSADGNNNDDNDDDNDDDDGDNDDSDHDSDEDDNCSKKITQFLFNLIKALVASGSAGEAKLIVFAFLGKRQFGRIIYILPPLRP